MPPRRSAALSRTEFAGRGAGRGGSRSAVVIGSTRLRVEARGGEHRPGELVPRHRALVGDVEQPGAPLDHEAAHRAGEVGGEGRVAPLVVDERAAGRAPEPAAGSSSPCCRRGTRTPTRCARSCRRRRAPPRRRASSGRTPTSGSARPTRRTGRPSCRRTRSRSRRSRGRRRPGSRPRRCTGCRARCTRNARSGSPSQASTAVHAAAWTTASGARGRDRLPATASRSLDVEGGVVARDDVVADERGRRARARPAPLPR